MNAAIVRWRKKLGEKRQLQTDNQKDNCAVHFTIDLLSKKISMVKPSAESTARCSLAKELSCIRVESYTGKNLFKCSLCTPDKFEPSFKSAEERHIKMFHWNHKIKIASQS